jgi:hypothetical protein
VHFKRRFAASVIAISGIVATCLGASAQVGSASTTPASVKLLVVTAVQQQQLRKLYAAYRHLPVSDVARIVPGSAHEAVVTSTGQDWASIAFAPSAKASAALAIKFQDGAGAGIFTKAKGGNWKTAALGGEPLGCAAHLPTAIRQVWHLAACPVTPSSPVGPRGPVAPESVTDQVGDIADDEVGVADNPAVTNFNGLDCNPFTAIEVPSVSTSGCGIDPRFDIRDGSEFWCADFAKWVWAQSGVTSDLGVLTAAAASFYTWGADHGESMPEDATDPAVGDAVVFYPDTAPNGSYADHVGIVTGVNANGTVNLANGDFLGSSNISVQANDDVSLKSWAASIWGSGEDWAFVSPQLPTANRDPSVAVDKSGNIYAFWENTGGGLETSDYTASTGLWAGPSQVTDDGTTMAQMGSEPTVAVGPQTSGGVAYQYVFWEGGNQNLYEAYWNGSWHGPIGLGDGPLGSAPTAGADSSGNIDVFWENTGRGLEKVSYTASTGAWSGPSAVVTAAGGAMGPLGSSPSVAVDANGDQSVFWEGTGSSPQLFEAYWTGAWHGPVDIGDGPLGSPPTAGSDSSDNVYVFWENTGAGLEEVYHTASTGAWTGPLDILSSAGASMGPLGSAPTVGVGPTADLYVFWRGSGTDRNLWEAAYNGSSWTGPTDDGFGPLG